MREALCSGNVCCCVLYQFSFSGYCIFFVFWDTFSSFRFLFAVWVLVKAVMIVLLLLTLVLLERMLLRVFLYLDILLCSLFFFNSYLSSGFHLM